MQMTFTKPLVKPPIITLIGDPGTGKTSLGAMFPNPVFMQAEAVNGVFDTWAEEMKPDLAPMLPKAVGGMVKGGPLQISTKLEILNQIQWFIDIQHNYSTLILDSASVMHRMLEAELCLRDGVDNIAEACGGFQKGFLCLADWHLQIVRKLEELRDRRGMTIIILAHSGIQRMKNRPDLDDYTVYSMDMNDKSVPVYVSLSDAVLYLVKAEITKDKEVNTKGAVTKYGKMLQTGQRKIITTGDGQLGRVLAKNRYNFPPEILLNQGENPLLQYIPYFNPPVAQAPAQAQQLAPLQSAVQQQV